MGTSGPAKLILSRCINPSIVHWGYWRLAGWETYLKILKSEKASYLRRLSCRPHRQAQGLLGGPAIRHDVGPAENWWMTPIPWQYIWILTVPGKTLYAYYMLVLSASISRRIVYKEPPETC